MPSLSLRRADRRALVMGAALLLLALAVLLDAAGQTLAATYGMGPAAMPYAVAALLAALGAGHVVAAFRDGLPVPGEADWAAIGWITLGLAALLLCIGLGAGFVLATTLLFALTARAFGRRALLADAGIGFALGVGIYLLFAKVLTLSLPAGPLERLL